MRMCPQFSKKNGYQWNRAIKNSSLKIQAAPSNAFYCWVKRKAMFPTNHIYHQRAFAYKSYPGYWLYGWAGSSNGCPSCKYYFADADACKW